MTGILTVTLNPALDVTTSVERLEARRKLRCAAPRYEPGGGGINVSRAVKELGGESVALVALGGATGWQLQRMLEDAGIALRASELDGETRISFKVMEQCSNDQYRFVLPGPEQEAAHGDVLLGDIDDCLAAGSYRYVVASGSLPPGLRDDLFADLARRLHQAGCRLILDTSGRPLQAALAAKPYLIKPDRHEARSLLDHSGSGATAAELADELLEREAAEVVILTLGAEGAIVASAEAKLRIRPPEVEVRSTVGAGDSFVAALVLGLAQDWPLSDAARYGVAAAASAVTTDATALCERQATLRYFTEIADKIERLR